MNPEQQNIGADAHAARFRHPPKSTPLDGYTIKRGIGIGGFGEVYFAISDAGKEVALKRIQRNLDVELRGVQNCLNLKHVNLISLWDIRTDRAGDSWVVMEYVPGPSLRDIIEVHEKGMPGHQIERWFSPIANGVGYLHESGLVHRDLKPANIFLDEDENVIKIGDYGLSKIISSSQGDRQTETVGTFHYMAPEIGKGSYGKGIDIYAMGIVLFEMLTGDVPFRGESSQEIIMKHLTANADLRQVPSSYQEAIRRSLLKDPDQRIGSIEELQGYLPWNSKTPTILNSNRFNLRDTVSAKSKLANRIASQHDQKKSENLERSKSEDGILFGPLRDSTAGTIASDEDVLYIENTHGGNLAGVVKKAIAGKAEPKPGAEPIANAVQTGWEGVLEWWNDNSVSTPLKAFLLVASVVTIVMNSEWLLPVSLCLGFVYLLYFGVRNVFFSPLESELQIGKLQERKRDQLLQSGLQNQLLNEDFITRASALTGAMLVAAVVCVALNLLGIAVTDSLFAGSIDSWALFTWSTIVCVVGSWGVLAISKYFETQPQDWLQRRLAMLIVGALVGGIGLVMAVYFNIDFADAALIGFNPLASTSLMLNAAHPVLLSILFFAAMFCSLRWWRMVDPTRKTRLSIWSVGLCLVLAAVVSHVLNFVPLISCLAIVIVSVAVQLSAPWINSQQRDVIVKTESKVMG